MSDWRLRPTLIEEWEESIDSVLAIDENGTVDLKGIRNNFRKVYSDKAHNDRWFTISGIAINRSEYPRFVDLINTVKYSHWDDGCFNYSNGNKRVVFHSREVRKRIGPFNPKNINYSSLMDDITAVIDQINFDVYSSTIDKAEHILKYSNPYPVYNLCMEFIIERYCRSLKRLGQNGILLLESRGKREDKEILTYIVGLLENGNRYFSGEDLCCIKGVYFNPKWSKKHQSKMSFPILELADLVSYPIHKYVKLDTKDLAYGVVEKKINNYPDYAGYGLKVFP